LNKLFDEKLFFSNDNNNNINDKTRVVTKQTELKKLRFEQLSKIINKQMSKN